MSFTTPCYITLTDKEKAREVCNKLLRLGYEFVNDSGRYVNLYLNSAINKTGKIIISTGTDRFHIHRKTVKYLKRKGKYNSYGPHVDCGTNESIFYALAAKRDDISANQYWVFDQDYSPHCKKGHFVIGHFRRCSCYCHVATVEELIEHFKTKEQFI